MTTFKQQIKSLCNNRNDLFDYFFYIDSHTKRKRLEEYIADIELQHNLFKLEERNIKNQILTLHSSKYFTKISEIVSLLTSDGHNEALILAAWIVICRLASPLEKNLEQFNHENIRGNSFVRYLKKSEPLSSHLFQQDLAPRVRNDHRFNQMKDNPSFFINPSNRSKYDQMDRSFQSLSKVQFEGSSTLSLPNLSLIQPPTIIPSKEMDIDLMDIQKSKTLDRDAEVGGEFSEDETVCSDLWNQAANSTFNSPEVLPYPTSLISFRSF
jgi:hypothetical protein